MQTQEKEAQEATTAAAWLTYRQAQEHAGLGRTTLTNLVTSGEILAAKVGKAVRINRASLDQYMRSHAYAGASRD